MEIVLLNIVSGARKYKMILSKRFYHIVANVGWFAGVPSLFSWIGGKYGYNDTYVFVISALLVWIIYTELRIRDLTKEVRKNKNGRK